MVLISIEKCISLENQEEKQMETNPKIFQTDWAMFLCLMLGSFSPLKLPFHIIHEPLSIERQLCCVPLYAGRLVVSTS